LHIHTTIITHTTVGEAVARAVQREEVEVMEAAVQVIRWDKK